jgi:hypothetical protein
VTNTNCIISATVRQHRGVCRRCGWTGYVSHVPVTDYQHLKSAVVFGQICDDCAIDLFPTKCGPGVVAERTGASPSGPRIESLWRHPAKDRVALSLV